MHLNCRQSLLLVCFMYEQLDIGDYKFELTNLVTIYFIFACKLSVF